MAYPEAHLVVPRVPEMWNLYRQVTIFVRTRSGRARSLDGKTISDCVQDKARFLRQVAKDLAAVTSAG